MNTSCQKCGNGVIRTCYGYSNTDCRGERYEYMQCVICGKVQHLKSTEEINASMRALALRLPDYLEVNTGAMVGHN